MPSRDFNVWRLIICYTSGLIRHRGHGVQLQGLVPLKKTELLDDNYSQVIYKTMVVPEQQLLIQY